MQVAKKICVEVTLLERILRYSDGTPLLPAEFSKGQMRTMSGNSIPGRMAATTLLFATAVAMCQAAQFNFRSVDLPGATATTALGISPQDDIVGRYVMGGAGHSYQLSNGAVTTFDPPYGIPGTSAAWGINPQGVIMGLYTDYGTVPGGDKFRTRAFLRDTSGNFTQIDFPGAENTFAIKISPTGQVVGCYHHQNADFPVSDGGTMHGYVYQNGSYQSLSVPGTMNNGITRDGRIIVGVWWPTQAEYHAYKVENGVYSLLDLRAMPCYRTPAISIRPAKSSGSTWTHLTSITVSC